MRRTRCVLCECDTLDPFYLIESFPLLASSTTTDSALDVYADLEFRICRECRCVQLATLVDPVTLYADDNKTSLTSMWTRHHTAFVQFIEQASIHSLCEVGGGSNPLVSFFSRPPMYSVLDIYECPNKAPSVTYKIGNCESFTGYTEDSVVLSHTFEHLYTPRAFLESIRMSSVKNVFISVPHFARWLENTLTVNILFNQHTFYFEADDIERLFQMYGFNMLRTETFGDHSLFFHFQRGNTQPTHIQRSLKEDKVFRHFNIKASHIRRIVLTSPTYIMPSFYVGQLIYHYLPDKALIGGFLDNDANKIGKRLYGTELLTYPPSILATSECKTVMLLRTPYFAEMHAQLKAIDPDIVIIAVDIT
jgi:hypothetical protein